MNDSEQNRFPLPEETVPPPVTEPAVPANDPPVAEGEASAEVFEGIAPAAECKFLEGTDASENEETAENPEPAEASELTPAPAAPAPEPEPLYRWTYAAETARTPHQKADNHRGVWVYAAVMTGVFLISFGLLIAVLLSGRGGELTPLLRPGISNDVDEEAVEGVEQAKHSVVVIEVTTAAGGGSGTGIIMTADGYIATNHHVIEGATKIRVKFYDGTYVAAELVGSSEMDDLAVIRVNRQGLRAATFAFSDDCYVGETVYAIGAPAGVDFGWTTTRGIISFKDREVKIYDELDGTLQKKLRLLQTDANVNPGNSGGPLINTKGEVVGVVSMKLSEGYEGIGFAIPSDGAVEVLEAIMKDGNADNVNSSLSHKRPMLGIVGVYMEADTYYVFEKDHILAIPENEIGKYNKADLICPAASGIYVREVTPGMGADGKLRLGDIITAVQGTEILSMNDLMNIVNDYYAGDTITLTVYRGRVYTPIDIVLSAKPAAD